MFLTNSYAAHRPDEDLRPYALERRTPGPNDVEIDIEFCGICHSDIHTIRGEWGPQNYPFVAGHEIVGATESFTFTAKVQAD